MKTIKLSGEAYEELRECLEKGQASFDTLSSDPHTEIYKALEGVNLVTIYGLPYVCNQTAEGGMGGQGSYPSCRILTPVERVEIVPEFETEVSLCLYCSKAIEHHTQRCSVCNGYCCAEGATSGSPAVDESDRLRGYQPKGVSTGELPQPPNAGSAESKDEPKVIHVVLKDERHTEPGRVNADVCAHCSKQCTPEGHDACLGTLKGGVMNACCGHGDDEAAYIQFDHKDYKADPNKYLISGGPARVIQEALKGRTHVL